MPYLGHSPTQAGSFVLLDDIEGTGTGSFNGSTLTFNLKVGGASVSPKASSILVAIDGVIQQSPSAYSVSGSTIVFTGAPASTQEFYGILMGQSASVGAGTITTAEMAANSVDSDQYVDGSIDLAHMSVNSIDSDQYVDGSIDNAHLADDAADSDEIAAGAIDLAHMSVNSIDSDQYVDLSIDNAHVATGLDAVKIADGSVTNAEFQYIGGLTSAAATLSSPTLTGTPLAPTASAATNTTQIATTAFVITEFTSLIDSAPGALNTLNELAAALGDDAAFSTTVTNSLATKATKGLAIAMSVAL